MSKKGGDGSPRELRQLGFIRKEVERVLSRTMFDTEEISVQLWTECWEGQGCPRDIGELKISGLIVRLRAMCFLRSKFGRSGKRTYERTCRPDQWKHLERELREHVPSETIDNLCLLSKLTAGLSAKDLELLYLKFYRGLTNDEIATETGVTVLTVFNNLHRVLDHLRFRLRKELLDA